jgi:fructose-1,6-bisphosphatase
MRRNWKRTSDGKIMVNGKKYMMLVGSRRQVWNGTAYKTGHGKAGLTRKHLMMNKNGNIVSKKRSVTAKRKKNLGKYIDLARKNKGKTFKKMTKSKTRKRRRRRRRK